MSSRFLKSLINGKELADGEIFKGDLELEGKATWTCDSTSQWAWRGEDKEFQYLIDTWKEQGIYEDILNGIIHLIWTGGEPTIKGHQEAIVNFHQYWADNLDENQDKVKLPIYDGGLNEYKFIHSPLFIFNEIETNGTIYIEDGLMQLIDQINCSPKLSNSGLIEKQRIKPEAIKRIMEHSNYQFKFVISNEEDVQEVFRDFIVPFSIPLTSVVCMPGLDSQTDFHERTQFVLEMAKKYKFRGLTRLHISAWDKTLNV
jgi:organic radical activating enzyme